MISAKGNKLKRILTLVIVILFWFIVWWIASLLVNKPLYMPSPQETFVSLWSLLGTESFWLSAALTFYRVIVGLAISFTAGILLAFLASRWSVLQSLLRPLVTAAKAIPVMSIIVLALNWFSASSVPIFSCVLLCFPIFYSNTLAGIKSVDMQLLEMAAVYNVSKQRVIRGISIPSVLPHVYSALSICLGFSWKSVVAAEVLSSPKYSMGFNMYATKLYLDTPQLFAWTITIVIISLIVEKGLKRILPGGKSI